MRKGTRGRAALALACWMGLGTIGAGEALAGPGEPPVYQEIPGVRVFIGEVIARPKQMDQWQAEGVDAATAAARMARARLAISTYQVVDYLDWIDAYVLRVPAGSNENAEVARLHGTGDFDYIEPNWGVWPLACSNDQGLQFQYHHDAKIMASCEAWDLHTGTPDVTIGFCDTGIRVTHEDLLLHRKLAYNAVDRQWEHQGGAIQDIHGHGTWVTGCGAGNGNNEKGISGVGWNLSHRMLRVSNDPQGFSSIAVLNHAVQVSVTNGDRVQSVSYGGCESETSISTAKWARDRNCLVFWAAGNESRRLIERDRDLDKILIVAATDSSDRRAGFSNFGKFVDFSAPGVNVYTTDRTQDNAYGSVSGTSFSCPLAAGLAALIMSYNRDIHADEVERIMKESCDDLGDVGVDDFFGYGRINSLKALQLVIPPVPTGPTSEYFLSSGEVRRVFVAQKLQVKRQWVHESASGYTSAMAVSGSVRSFGRSAGNAGAEYTLNGTFTGLTFPFPEGLTGVYTDGATDGIKNFAVDSTTGRVVEFTNEWKDPIVLFTAPNQQLSGITFNPVDRTFWLSAGSTDKVYRYSYNGTLLSSFSTGHTKNQALAMDYADGTLWLRNGNNDQFEQWTTDGRLRQTLSFSLISSTPTMGGEFKVPPPPATGPLSEYYLSSGDERRTFVVKGLNVLRSWSHTTQSGYTSALAVLDFVRTLGLKSPDKGAEYDLQGRFTGKTFTFPNGLTGQYADGATDGLFNYAVDLVGNRVVRFSLEWGSPIELFKVPAEQIVGITYDAEADTFWVSAFASTRVYQYNRAGQKISEFTTGHTANVALAMDYADGTLWLYDRNSQNYEQWTRDGRRLQSMKVSGLGGSNTLGGEFKALPRPWCYADCDRNGLIDVRDFFCFQTKYAEGDPYADCDGNGRLDLRDFFCFQGRYAGGCN